MSTDHIRFSLDGIELQARPGESILAAARRSGIAIPQLCWQHGLRADGNCRACVVEIVGERVLAPSCARQPKPGMVVHSANRRARQAQRLVLELLRSDTPATPDYPENELDQWCARLGVNTSRFASTPNASPLPPGEGLGERASDPGPIDDSHPAIAVRWQSCIQCGRCLRACRDSQVNDVIGYAGRGAQARIVFDLADALGDSSCVGCGECVQVCPTDALSARQQQPTDIDREVDSVCPYCGVGCLLRYQVANNTIQSVSGRDGETNHGRLCVKGRFGYDYVSHPQRLTRPLIRRDDAAKDPDLTDFDPGQPLKLFREASWDEALQHAAGGLLRIRDQHGGAALAGFGSAKGSNEEAYLFQKLVRTGLGSHNVDHCTRLCHASSVAALLEMIGSGAVSNPVADVAHAEVILIVGSNTSDNHPVAATFIKNAVRAGSSLIVIDPRRTDIARHARHHLQFRPGGDIALFNALMQAIIEYDLIDADFIARRTNGYAELKQQLQAFTPEAMAPICGIPAATIREVARLYASADRAMIFWGMGISQHVHGTDNARALIALALICGHIGRPGTGLHPLRGQNNVQGASDVGLIPMMLPDYQPVADAAARQRFETLWGRPLSTTPGLSVVEIIDAAARAEIKGMYIMGENPAMSDPNLHHSRKALARLDHLVVQDLFLTETAALADVILPASAFPEKTGSFTNTDRRVQLGRAALTPPGDARQDLWIIQQIAHRLGLNWDYADAAAVFTEMRQAMPSIAGISMQRLQQADSITYPCRDTEDPGQPVLFSEQFPTADGRATLTPAPLGHPDELPDADYPQILITGRQLEHWHTGAMSRRSRVLDALQPSAVAFLHPEDLQRLGIDPGEPITISSRRGSVTAASEADPGLLPGQVFLPFCYTEAAANLLTNPALDPDAHIPEFKFCAVKLLAVTPQAG